MLECVEQNGTYRACSLRKNLETYKIFRIPYKSGKPQQVLTVELRNGTQDTLSPSQAGFDGSENGILLEDDQGTQLDLFAGGYQTDNGGIFKALPRAGGFITRWTFGYPTGTEENRMGMPKKLLIPIKISTWQRNAPKDTKIADPSFRIDLGCTK